MKNQLERLRIKEWMEEDRPREKLIKQGRKFLSNAELLAILIGSGNKNETAVELSQKILTRYGQLNKLLNCSVEELTSQFHGIGEAKAVTILAALELSRRINAETDSDIQIIHKSKDIYLLMKSDLSNNIKEEAWIIYLNTANKVLKKTKVSEGGLTHCIFDPKLILREAIQLMATGIIMVHNHPSGRTEPSIADKEVTRKMQESCKLCDIHLLDHVIIGNNLYYSFHDMGLV